MPMPRPLVAARSLLALAVAALFLAPRVRAQEPILSRDRVSAQGRQSAVIRVARFGRYSIRVTSPQGTGLQLTDRMAGPGPVAGAPGERDGRLDVFLDRGEYLVMTLGHRVASGDATLAVHAFAPASDAEPPRLEELKLVSTSLRDLEQRSWWLDLSEPRRVDLEAAGRSLADLRLWKEGRWLVDAAPTARRLQPRDGQPLLALQLVASLEPGLYLLAAYGGAEQPWAEPSDDDPLYLRWGIPPLGSAGRRRHELSLFGIDRFLVPGAVTSFRVELPEARPLELRVSPFDPEQPFAEAGARVAVEKTSVPPVAELDRPPVKGHHVVTVSGEAGQPYVLQHFERLDHYTFSGSRPHWISTIHSGHAADSIDATGVLIEMRPDAQARDHVVPLRSQVVEIGPETLWRRRANLLGTTTLFVRVKKTGQYAVTVEDAEATVRVEPFLLSTPAGYRSPAFQPSGATWSLDAGFYTVTLEPQRKGVATVEVRPAGILDRLLQRVGLGEEAAEGPVVGAVRFEDVPLHADALYRLFVNRQPGVSVGAVVRPLPLDLTDPLPVWQRPGEEVAVPFEQREAGTLSAEDEDGERLEVSVDGAAWQRAVAVAPGRHTARVRVGGEATRAYGLAFVPERLDPRSPLPELSPERLATLPEFPRLALGSKATLDLARGGQATYLLDLPGPGLYRLESTGLLATEGNLRTRTTTSLVRRAENGVGRNFAIQSYLTPGDYQLSVAPRGRSAGHLGLSLARSPLRRGGFLTLYRPARASLRAGEAVEYRFIITEPGEFRVRALGSGDRRLRCRLDDRDGWPLVPPEGAADLTRRFDPGHYRFVILPEETDARVVSVIEPVPHPRRYSGHGPHALPLGRRVESVWMEPEAGAPRVPDVWELELPAAAELRLEVGGEMRGRLLREVDGGLSETAEVPARRGFQGRLERGRYRLELTAARVDNRAPYALAAWPVPLLAGLERELELPAEVPVAVGETGLVELASFGTQDVRARLLDARGAVVAASDDRPDDWNFAIGRSLDAGDYTLRVEPVGAARGKTAVSMRQPALVEEPPLTAPAEMSLVAGDAAHLYPLVLPRAAELLLVSARTDEGVGLALERREEDAWHTVDVATGRRPAIEVPLGPLPFAPAAPGYRLRLWSLDRRESPVRLELAAMAPTEASEARLASGLALTALEGPGPGRAVAAVRLDRPGLLRAAATDALRWCPAVDLPCQEARDGLVPATGERVWVVADRVQGAPAPRATAKRVVLQPGKDGLVVPLPERAPLLCDVGATAGGPLLLLARSLAGQPGVDPLGLAPGPAARMAVGPGSTVAVRLSSDAGPARLWRATPEATEARVLVRAFSAPRSEDPIAGALEGALDAGEATSSELPGGARLVRLTLDPALVAVLSQGDEVGSVHWGGGAALGVAVETTADHLTLLHPGEPGAPPARYVVEALAVAEGVTTRVAPGSPVERATDRTGRLRLAAAPLPGGGLLHVRGASEDAVLVDDLGRVQRGLDLDLLPGRGGALSVPHRPGLLLAWSTPAGVEAQGPWPEAAAGVPQAVTLPATLALSGPWASYQLRLDEPAVVHLRTATAVATRLVAAGAGERVEVHPEGARLDAFLPEGSGRLTLRGLAGGLTGRAELTTTPVIDVGEGLGPSVLLSPGTSRFFSFEVEHPGPVGIGVRASEDVVEALLFDAGGAPLGRGAAQMPRLEAGTYLLELRAPRDVGPVTAQAAVVGLEPPDTGPPEEVVRQYLERFAVREEER
jgi:hypothetical protein